eukprot:EG_transcript_27638
MPNDEGGRSMRDSKFFLLEGCQKATFSAAEKWVPPRPARMHSKPPFSPGGGGAQCSAAHQAAGADQERVFPCAIPDLGLAQTGQTAAGPRSDDKEAFVLRTWEHQFN